MRDNRFEGKTAVISGGARGMGAEFGKRFVEEGAQVALLDVLDEAGEETARQIGAYYGHLDVTNEDAWESALFKVEQEFGGIDILVNNAGILRRELLTEGGLDGYREVMDVNFFGVVAGTKAAAPIMRKRGRGAIVNMSSISGMMGSIGLGAYCSSKWAVRGFSKVAAVELGEFGIRVNSVHPGPIDTDMVRMSSRRPADPDGRYKPSIIGRLGKASEVANIVLFLASDEASFMTGGEYLVDGGWIVAAEND